LDRKIAGLVGNYLAKPGGEIRIAQTQQNVPRAVLGAKRQAVPPLVGETGARISTPVDLF
jgi:hypothetical protein